MARFSNGSSGRLGKRSRNASETASLSSWGSSEVVLSDSEERKRDLLDYSGKAGSSSDEESQQSLASRGKRPKCFSRNAVLARQNRQKKKKYVEDLENELHTLRKENLNLKVSLKGYGKDVDLVRKENIYLRNVLANSPEICQLIRSVNINCGLPTSTSRSEGTDLKRPCTAERVPHQHPEVENTVSSLDSCVPVSGPYNKATAPARTVRKDFPIAVDDVSLSLSAPEEEDELSILFGSKEASLDFELDDPDYLGFGPNSLGDWLDGDEPLAHVGVCLHVANKKVSLEFCSTCNENAFSHSLNSV